MRRKLAAGNWKMNGTGSSLSELDTLANLHPNAAVDILICPPATLLGQAAMQVSTSSVSIGAQDCHADTSGAHTGDISAEMVTDVGATAVILGHSERREDHNEDSELVRIKARAAHAAGLTAIICLGESEAQRDAANTLDIIAGQLAISTPDTATADNTVIAYEPIWAIGTGKVPTLVQIAEVHDFIREKLTSRFGPEIGNAIRLLYGGSVKPTNADDIFTVSNVDGALVGGASLKATDFSPIITALEGATI
ncbi:triose-phosphate isomerase [Roseovarius sp. EL26]|uniref:triose-phosphate isomerase n=1 Tax=Roseovarius sp. EL26 TaxID=2126672 RepID=UPI000EA1047C|nr:triose-phosphate isomerase [Roseovarius sp. EL26]